MNCNIDVKHEEDPLSCNEIKTEPCVSYTFYILFCVILHKTDDIYVETHYNCCFTGCTK